MTESGSEDAARYLLIVEDSRSFAGYLKKHLEETLCTRWKIAVVVARSHAEAVQAVDDTPQPFFLGILDLHLPDAQHGEIVDSMLAHGIPSLVLTGEYRAELRERFLAKGVLDYFVKDNLQVVEAVGYFVDRLLRNRNTQVLVVDDSSSFRHLLRTTLQRYGFIVLEANSGEEALTRLDQHHIHLALVDYQMPGMDGFQLTRKIRTRFSRHDLAILGVSSQGKGDLAVQFIKAGANDFLLKPFQNEELFCRISQNLEIIEKHEELEGLVQERTVRLTEALSHIRSREQYLHAILETALDAIVAVGDDGRIIGFNPAAERLFGYPVSAVLGRQITGTLLPEPLWEKHVASIASIAVEDDAADSAPDAGPRFGRRVDVTALRADGRTLDLEMAVSPVDAGNQHFYTAFMRDVTERKQLVRSLEETLTVAEAANRAKSEFLANMSHEIRTPMNAIIGMTDLVLDTELEEEQRENLEIVQRSSQSLLELINSILDLSKIDAGKFKLEKIPFDLLGRVETACETLAVRAQQKGLELICRIAPNVPETLIGDPLRLSQVLINLLNNAIKFTREGEVRLIVLPVMVGETLSDRKIHFRVEDTGIGIPADRQAAIFQRFSQADGSTTRKYGGTGLGLTISKHLVEMMGGVLKVESTPDHGSQFSFTATFIEGSRQDAPGPRVENQRSVPSNDKRHALAGVSIMVAYASVAGRRSVVESLRYFGATVTGVADIAALATQLATAHTGPTPVQLVVIDESLIEPLLAPSETHPGGLPAAPEWPGRAIVLLPTTSTADSVPLAQIASTCSVVRKPARRFQLFGQVNRALGRVPAPAPSAPERAARPASGTATMAPGLRILLVDDVEENRKLARGILEKVNHTVTMAVDGQDALLRVQEAPFDLILMDLQMPELDGHQATAAIRARTDLPGNNACIPIIAMTAHAYEEERTRCLEQGMDDFIRKPYQASELLRVVDRHRATLAAPTPPAPPPPPSPPPPPPVTLTGDGESRARFIQQVPLCLQALTSALTARDPRLTLKQVEQIQSVAVAVGAQRVKMRANFLGRKAEMKAWDETGSLYQALEQEVEAVMAALNTVPA